MKTTPRELFERLHTLGPPLILDVRNKEEFARWKIEGPQMPETLNVPHVAFIEGISLGGVATFLGDAARSRVSLFIWLLAAESFSIPRQRHPATAHKSL